MKIDVDDVNQLLSHVMLQSNEVVDLVAETSDFKKHSRINAEVSFNGVKVDGSVMEEALHELFKQVKDYYRSEYGADDIDKMIDQRAKELFKDRVAEFTNDMKETFDNLESKLSRIHWD